MTNLLPPELFSEPQIRSDAVRFAPSYAFRRVITLTVILLLIAGGVYWAAGRAPVSDPNDIPVIKAEGSYKQRPEQPGGIDIPHQDVQVYQELDARNSDKPQAEHLLPLQEVPQLAPTVSLPVNPKPSIATGAAESLLPDGPLTSSQSDLKNQSALSVAPLEASIPVSDTPVLNQVNPPPVAAIPKPGDGLTPSNIVLPATQKDMSPSMQMINPKAQALEKIKADNLTIEQIIKNNSSTGAKRLIQSKISVKSVAIQLASVPDQSAALHDLKQLQEKYSIALGNVILHVVRADLAKGTYYRIQGVVSSEQQARMICANIKKMNTGCILAPIR